MYAFWTTAVGATGVAGIGAFVFYALYRDWLHLAAFATLTREQRFRLFIVFLVLTFCFATATLGLAGYRSYLGSGKVQTSAEELKRTVKSRHEAGEAILEQAAEVVAEENGEFKGFRNDYEARAKAVEQALDAGDMNQYHEAQKDLIELVEGDRGRKALPEDVRKSLLDTGCAPP